MSPSAPGGDGRGNKPQTSAFRLRHRRLGLKAQAQGSDRLKLIPFSQLILEIPIRFEQGDPPAADRIQPTADIS